MEKRGNLLAYASSSKLDYIWRQKHDILLSKLQSRGELLTRLLGKDELIEKKGL